MQHRQFGSKEKENVSASVKPRSNFNEQIDGNVGIFFALALIPMLSIIGASIDLGQAYTYKKQLQELTDAASVAGARLPATSNDNRMNAIVTNFEHNAATKNLINLKPEYTANNAEVGVKATATSPTTILKLLGVDGIPVEAKTRARSQVQNGGVICLLALDENAPEGLHLQGINKMSQQDCWAWVNSKADTAINAVGASTGKAQGFCVAGGVLGADHFAPPPFRGCDPYADPFKDKFASNSPYVGDCTKTNLRIKNTYAVLTPGTYCGGINIGVHAQVLFMPGTYVIKNGMLDMDAQSSAVRHRCDLLLHRHQHRHRHQERLRLGSPCTDQRFLRKLRVHPGQDIQPGRRRSIFRAAVTSNSKASFMHRPGKSRSAATAKSTRKPSSGPWSPASFHMEGNGQLYINSDAEAIGMKNVMPKIPTGPLIMN